MKLVKKLVGFLLWTAGIVVVLVLALPLWIGPVAKTAANLVVPKKTGTGFNLGAFALNPYTGKLAVGDVQLYNPAGFDQKMAVTVGSFNGDVDMASLAGGPIVVREIALKDVFVSYVTNMKGENNFAIIKKNATGKDESKAKAKGEGVKVKGAIERSEIAERSAGLREQRSDKLSSSQTSQTHQTSQTSKKVIIDRLLIQNVMVQMGPIPISSPMNIELTGIGRKSNGVTMQEAWEQIYAQVLQNLGSLGINVDGVGNVELGKALMAVGAAGDLSKKEGRKRAVKNLVDAFLGGVVEIGDAAGRAKGSVGGGAKQATDSVGTATKDTTDAVGEQADKTVNELKGLFK